MTNEVPNNQATQDIASLAKAIEELAIKPHLSPQEESQLLAMQEALNKAIENEPTFGKPMPSDFKKILMQNILGEVAKGIPKPQVESGLQRLFSSLKPKK